MIPVLSAFLGLLLLSAGAEFLRHARWIDRVALVAFIALGLVTRPSHGDHRTAITDSIMSERGAHGVMMGTADRAVRTATVMTRLEHRALFIVSIATRGRDIASVGLFGRVFVLEGVSERR